MHLSAGISGTVNSASLAAQQLEGFPVRVIDTRCAAAAHMLAVEAGARAAAHGSDLEGVVAAVEHAIAQQRTVFTVDTLEYLYKGGRIGGAAALLGSLLQFKPMLTFTEGRINALERVRKSSRALARLVEVMAGWTDGEPQRAVIMEAAAAGVLRPSRPCYPSLNVIETQIVPLTPSSVPRGDRCVGPVLLPGVRLRPRRVRRLSGHAGRLTPAACRWMARDYPRSAASPRAEDGTYGTPLRGRRDVGSPRPVVAHPRLRHPLRPCLARRPPRAPGPHEDRVLLTRDVA